MLAKLLEPGNGVSWDKTLETIQCVLNNTVHRTINQHPSIMLFGTSQKGKRIDSFK